VDAADPVDPVGAVTRLVDEVMNGGELDRLDELCVPKLAPKLRDAFSEFRTAFPDWQQQLVETVSDGHTVVARMRCTGTHLGTWQGLAPTRRTMRIDEVYFFRVRDGVVNGVWGLEDTWTRMRQLAGDDATLGELGSLS
jgi:predicted ester cyclase